MAETAAPTSIKVYEESRGVRALKAGTLTPKIVAAFLSAIVLIVASLVIIVWTRHQVVRLGYEIDRANQTLVDLRTEHRELTRQRYETVNLETLDALAAQYGLVKPEDDQILVIYAKEPATKD